MTILNVILPGATLIAEIALLMLVPYVLFRTVRTSPLCHILRSFALLFTVILTMSCETLFRAEFCSSSRVFFTTFLTDFQPIYCTMKTGEIIEHIRVQIKLICSNDSVNEKHILQLENALIKGEELPLSMAHIQKILNGLRGSK